MKREQVNDSVLFTRAKEVPQSLSWQDGDSGGSPAVRCTLYFEIGPIVSSPLFLPRAGHRTGRHDTRSLASVWIILSFFISILASSTANSFPLGLFQVQI